MEPVGKLLQHDRARTREVLAKMETILLLVDAALVLGLGVWMAVAVADNWRHPALNREAVAMVVRFDLMAEQYPAEYAAVAHRRIEAPRLIDAMFHAIRLAETLAAAALIAAGLLLILAAPGLAPETVATGAAVLATAFFISIWAGFLIGGNYFCYWYCHQWGQANHSMLLFWGFFVLIVLLL
jgi:predicted small integral membrane protein